MESNQRVLKQKLGFFGILKEAVKITCKNPNFIIFTCLTSLPLLFSLFMYESLFMQTVIKAAKVLHDEEVEAESYYNCLFCMSWKPLKVMEHLIGEVSHNFLLLILSHLGITHLCDFLNTVATVNSASVIHAGDQNLSLKEMLIKHVMDSRFKGPLITSIYTLVLTSIISIGLLSLLMYTYIVIVSRIFMLLFLAMFVALLRQYIEWGAVWEMGIVISILQEKEGDVALVLASYLSRGNRGIGILLMIGSLLWRLGLRVVCLFIAMHGGASQMLILLVQISLVGFANIMKCVFFVVYYHDCKKWKSEKQVCMQENQGVLSV